MNKNIQLSSNVVLKLAALALFSALLVVLQILLAPRAHATTYSINPAPAPGECTLNDAITAINSQAISGGCSAGTSSNTINFAAGTHTLSAPPIITFDGDLSINGVSATTTILDGDGQEGFGFDPSSGAYTMSMSNLTLTNFINSAGGTVLFSGAGSISLDHLLIHDNICTYVDESTAPVCAFFLNNKGTSDQHISLTNSAIYNNSSAAIIYALLDSGGDSNIGLDIINNTFYGNDGSIVVLQDNVSGTNINLNFVNNTVSHNNTFIGYGWLAYQSTEGAIINTYAKNNIFDSNFTGDVPNNCGPYEFNSQGGNISSDDTCTTILTSTNDKNSTDPKLALPAFINGTYILPLNSDSPAIDNGLEGGLTPGFDQRGVARPQGSAPDSGSYEYYIPVPGLPNTGGGFSGDTNITGGVLALIAIIACGSVMVTANKERK